MTRDKIESFRKEFIKNEATFRPDIVTRKTSFQSQSNIYVDNRMRRSRQKGVVKFNAVSGVKPSKILEVNKIQQIKPKFEHF